MSKLKNGGLDQYGAEPFKHQQFGPAGVAEVKVSLLCFLSVFYKINNMCLIAD